MKKKILITGGSGYIGSCLFIFLKKNFDVYILDKENKRNWQAISKKNFYKCNILNFKKTERIIHNICPDVIIHLAGLSTVNEKFKKKDYSINNIDVMKNILKIMEENQIKNIIYSSTASVYKNKNIQINEYSKLGPISKYGKSKLAAEKLIKKKKNLNYLIFRFFNVASAITNPPTGEFHNPETHLIPSLIYNQNKNRYSNIYGKDYKTKDGTCMRDYIHVKDICRAIYSGIQRIEKKKLKTVVNLGNGKGYTNLDIIKAINKITKKKIKFRFSKKRKGDNPKLVCDIKKSKKILGWTPKFSTLKKIIENEIEWSFFLNKKKYKRKFI